MIIFGGRGKSDLASEDALYELDLTNYEWKIPKISGKIPKSRFWHRATVFNNYMIISFGKYNTIYMFHNIIISN
jgi:hypothetical protein